MSLRTRPVRLLRLTAIASRGPSRTSATPVTTTSPPGRRTTIGFWPAMIRASTTWAHAAFCSVDTQPAAAAARPAAATAVPARRGQAVARGWSAEVTAHVLPGPLLPGLPEELDRAAVLHHLPEVHEGHVVGDAICLLEVVGDDDHRHVLAQLDDQVLDHLRGL